jgi:hypothetical protein
MMDHENPSTYESDNIGRNSSMTQISLMLLRNMRTRNLTEEISLTISLMSIAGNRYLNIISPGLMPNMKAWTEKA